MLFYIYILLYDGYYIAITTLKQKQSSPLFQDLQYDAFTFLPKTNSVSGLCIWDQKGRKILIVLAEILYQVWMQSVLKLKIFTITQPWGTLTQAKIKGCETVPFYDHCNTTFNSHLIFNLLFNYISVIINNSSQE